MAGKFLYIENQIQIHSAYMKPIEIVSNTLFYRSQDGRIIFRPWGSKGACYLVTEQQRRLRAKFQLAYHLALLILIVSIVERFGVSAQLAVVSVAWIAGNYILYWIFTRGLTQTEAPGKPGPNYVQEQIKANTANFGKPFLWALLIMSALMSVTGLAGGIFIGDYAAAVLTGGFFGFCCWIFAKRLRNA